NQASMRLVSTRTEPVTAREIQIASSIAPRSDWRGGRHGLVKKKVATTTSTRVARPKSRPCSFDIPVLQDSATFTQRAGGALARRPDPGHLGCIENVAANTTAGSEARSTSSAVVIRSGRRAGDRR